MFRAFRTCRDLAEAGGRLVIVFAHKQPDAWETLVSAIIRAGFVVDGSWPIQTERAARTGRSPRLPSPPPSGSSARSAPRRPPGWDNLGPRRDAAEHPRPAARVLGRGHPRPRLRLGGDGARARGVQQAPGRQEGERARQDHGGLRVPRAVRRIVVDFVVGRVLSQNGDGQTETGLDDVTTYYLLHRNDFGLDDAPCGACILYAVSCNLSDKDLVERHEILARTGGQPEEAEDDEGAEPGGSRPEAEEGTGSTSSCGPGTSGSARAWATTRGRPRR